MLQVAVAVFQSEHGVLVAQRQAGTHKAGMWEFPGGKIEAGENQWQALVRECQEELGVTAEQGRKLIDIQYHYPERSVDLHVYLVTEWAGELVGNEGQAIKWLGAEDHQLEGFLPMVKNIIHAVQLSSAVLITEDVDAALEHQSLVEAYQTQIDKACAQGAGAVLLRNKGLPAADYTAVYWALRNNNAEKARLDQTSQTVRIIAYAEQLLPVADVSDDAVNNVTNDAWLHYTHHQLMALTSRPDAQMISASCHDLASIEHANQLGCDFIFISPVRATRSHVNVTPLGMKAYEALLNKAQMPAYALGGMKVSDVMGIQSIGGQGIAAISGLLTDG